MPIKICFVFLFILVVTTSHAQVKFALIAGPQMTSARYTVNGIRQSTGFKPGVMAGLALKVPFDTHLYFFPSVYYSLKGYKVTLKTPSFPPTQLAINNNTTIHTFEVAPLFQVDLSGKPTHMFIRFGPSVDFAMAGREKFDTLDASGVPGKVNRSMVFSFTDYGRYTASAHVHVGYETPGLMVYAFYEHGIGSLNNADYGPHILHRIFGITAGWFFAERK
jgi:hypothetical protein